MYCTHCGKQIEDNSKFCPYCGGSFQTSEAESAKGALKRTAGAIMGSSKTAVSGVDETLVRPLQKIAEEVPKPVRESTNNVKDTSDFSVGNKPRSTLIIAVLLIAVLVIAVFFVRPLMGGDKEAEMAKEAFLTVISDNGGECDIKSVKKVGVTERESRIYLIEFIAEGIEGSVVVLVSDDKAIPMEAFPVSEYSQMEVYLERVKTDY